MIILENRLQLEKEYGRIKWITNVNITYVNK